MAIQYINSARYGSSSGAIPAGYAIGDLIVIWGYRSDGGDPGYGSGVGFELYRTGGFGSGKWILGSKIAESLSEVSGNWNGCDQIIITVFRDAMLNVNHNDAAENDSGGALRYGALTAASNSWMLAFVGTNNTDNTGVATPPTGMTMRNNGNAHGTRVGYHDSNGIMTSHSLESVPKEGTNGLWRTVVVELTNRVDATLNITETADAVGASSTVFDSVGTVNSRDRDSTFSAAAALARIGTLTITESNETVTSTSEMGRIATLTFTESGDMLAANSYADSIGTVNSRDRDTTIDGSGYVIVEGTLTWNESAETSSGNALTDRAASLTFAESNDTIIAMMMKELYGVLEIEESPDTLTTSGQLLVVGTLEWTEDDDYIVSGFDPDETSRRPDECRPIEEMVEEEIDKILTQYRESPNLLFLIRSALMAAGEAWDHLCDLPEYFDIDTAVGDQLTILGKRMGFPRCHCICEPPAFFGFKCVEDNGNPLTSIVGFCETGVWADCGTSGVTEVCIDDDDIYRKFLYVRRYQMLQRYDYESLKIAVRTLWGEQAKVISYGDGRVVIAPFRVLTETEKRLIKLIPRIMPVALGIRVLIHFSTYPKVAGFGEGWGGFCEEIPGEIIYTDTEGDRYMITENGIEYLAADEYTRDAYWLCPVDVKPYSC